MELKINRDFFKTLRESGNPQKKVVEALEEFLADFGELFNDNNGYIGRQKVYSDFNISKDMEKVITDIELKIRGVHIYPCAVTNLAIKRKIEKEGLK